MQMPDYGACVERVAEWIAAGAELTPGENMFVEVNLPENPDTFAALFETSGAWDVKRNLQYWQLQLVTRAPYLKDARALMAACITAAHEGFATATEQQRGIIQDLRLEILPRLQPRDERGRVYQEALFIMSISAPYVMGAEL